MQTCPPPPTSSSTAAPAGSSDTWSWWRTSAMLPAVPHELTVHHGKPPVREVRRQSGGVERVGAERRVAVAGLPRGRGDRVAVPRGQRIEDQRHRLVAVEAE